MVSGGSTNIHIHPLEDNEKPLKELLSMKNEEYEWTDQVNGEFVVESTLDKFCVGCYYFMKVETSSSFEGELMVLRMNDPLPLTVNHFLKDELTVNTSNAEETYLFYSITSFNLTFNLLQGG